MAVDKHPSRKPAEPYKPPRTSTTSGEDNKETISGQAGVHYGFRHEITVHDGESTMKHHFTGGSPSHKWSADRPGDEKGNDEPG